MSTLSAPGARPGRTGISAALYSAFLRLADDPNLGCRHLGRRRRGERILRLEEGSHVIFFRREKSGNVTVVRVLHERMLPSLYVG